MPTPISARKRLALFFKCSIAVSFSSWYRLRSWNAAKHFWEQHTVFFALRASCLSAFIRLRFAVRFATKTDFQLAKHFHNYNFCWPRRVRWMNNRVAIKESILVPIKPFALSFAFTTSCWHAHELGKKNMLPSVSLVLTCLSCLLLLVLAGLVLHPEKRSRPVSSLWSLFSHHRISLSGMECVVYAASNQDAQKN